MGGLQEQPAPHRYPRHKFLSPEDPEVFNPAKPRMAPMGHFQWGKPEGITDFEYWKLFPPKYHMS